jgi:predicted GNAT family acetyltransferase
MSEGEVRHNEAERRFEIAAAEGLAVLTYRRADGVVVLTHTIVPPALEGRGLGSRLVHAGLGWARSNGLRVVPQCPFVAAYIERHPEERDLVA